MGQAGYDAPLGRIKGELTPKRQLKILKGQIEYVFESEINIQDDVLQRELSHTSDEKMKTIIATIQKEQNQVIRNEQADTIIIQGVAGSGKTSIALHRIAYLLYRHKETLSAHNVVILSPNKVFADYISNVLPELGTIEYFEPVDYEFGRFIATREWILTRYTAYQNYPVKRRLHEVSVDVYNLFQTENLWGDELPRQKTIYKKLTDMFKFKNTLALYKDFYQMMKIPEKFVMLTKKSLEWADVYPFIYFHAAFEGLKENQLIRHVVIDEMHPEHKKVPASEVETGTIVVISFPIQWFLFIFLHLRSSKSHLPL